MAKYKRHEVIQTVYETKLVPLYYNANADVCKKVVKACYDGGARVFEFTNRGDFAHEVFAELSKYVNAELDGMKLGVGSVIDAGTASLYIQLGAHFIVSPLMNPDVAKVCNRRKIAWMPGCATVTEVNTAEELGAEIVKIFPGTTVGGPAFVKNLLAPCPWTSIMPSGGVSSTKENLTDWFNAGVACVGMGSNLVTKDDIKNQNYEAIKQRVADALALIKEITK